MEKVTRRAFIGGVGAILATGAMAMSGCAPKDDAKQAELSATGSDQPEATVPDETLEFDIAVVGAGCSGLAACVQAAESGASVICIEAKSIAGGAAGGVEGLFAVNSQIQKDQNITVSMGEMIRTELEQNQYRNSGLVLRDLVKADRISTGSYLRVCALARSTTMWASIRFSTGSRPARALRAISCP